MAIAAVEDYRRPMDIPVAGVDPSPGALDLRRCKSAPAAVLTWTGARSVGGRCVVKTLPPCALETRPQLCYTILYGLGSEARLSKVPKVHWVFPLNYAQWKRAMAGPPTGSK